MAAELMSALSFILGVFNPINTRRYLGLPSLVEKNKKAIFALLKDRLWQRLQQLCGKPLSKACITTLIKAAGQVIPVYYMGVFFCLLLLLRSCKGCLILSGGNQRRMVKGL